MPWRNLGQRSTTDLLILMIAGTISFSVLATGATVALVEIASKGNADTNIIVGRLSDVVNTMIGLLAGFLAGRTQQQANKPPSEQVPPPKATDEAA